MKPYIRIVFFAVAVLVLGGCKAGKAFKSAVAINDIPHYESFLSQYPEHKGAAEATAKLQLLYENRDWKLAIASGTSRALGDFLKKYPTSQLRSQAEEKYRILKEAEDWKEATLTETVGSFETFLEKHPASNHAGEARSRIEKLKEENAWQLAIRANTIADYQSFLAMHPSSSYAATARLRIKRIADERDWQMTKDQSMAFPYETYLKLHPTGQHVFEANNRIHEIRVVQPEWELVSKSGSYQDLRQFAVKFGSSSFGSKAQVKIDSIENAAYQSAKLKNTETSYQSFISAYPNSKYASAARRDMEAMEETEWDNVRATRTVAAVNSYISKFPSGKHSSEAAMLLKAYQQWEEVKRRNVYQGYADYLKQNPFSEFELIANHRMDSIEAAELEKVEKRNTLAGFTDFLKRFPGSPYSGRIKERIMEIEEETWEASENAATAASYRSYISKFPNGRHVEDANERIKEIVDPWYGWERKTVVTGEDIGCENVTPRYEWTIDNKLEVQVGHSTDVVIKIMELYTDKCIRIVYIRGGATHAIEHIPQSKYYLKIAYGKDWYQKVSNGQCIGKFKTGALYEKGEDILDFNIVRTWNGEQVPYFQLFLDVITTNGNTFDSNRISESEFNK